MSYEEMYAKAKAKGMTEQLAYEIKNEWAEGELFVGRLKDMAPVHFTETNTDATGYLFETDKGLIQTTLGAGVDTQMDGKWVIGAVYAITYKGKKQLSGSRVLKLYDIELVPEGN